MFFKKIQLSKWQQFGNVEIDFSPKLTIITGANGSGKTTILNLLARHSGWQQPSLATPTDKEGTGIFKYFSKWFDTGDVSPNPIFGTIKYENNQEAKVLAPQTNLASYQIQIQNQQQVKCFFIPSHRAVFRYQPIGNIPTGKKNKEQAFNEVSSNNRNRYFGSESQPSSFYMKNTLIGWAIQGYGIKRGNTSIMSTDNELISYFEGFEKLLRTILPNSLGFERLEIRNMEIVFICNGGKDEFLIETCSGGISSLIDIAWQIYMFSTDNASKFTVLIDELENHLHPTMQRTVLTSLVNAFPDVRFIITTHSPLIVTALPEASVFVLTYDENQKVYSKQLDLLKRAKTANEILDEVLGVPFTLPVWVEAKLREVIEKYQKINVNIESLRALRLELESLGLENMIPFAVEKITLKNDKAE